jgi:hypothetical protein
MKGLKPQNEIAAGFGFYGWSGEAVRWIIQEFEEMKVKGTGNLRCQNMDGGNYSLISIRMSPSPLPEGVVSFATILKSRARAAGRSTFLKTPLSLEKSTSVAAIGVEVAIARTTSIPCGPKTVMAYPSSLPGME